MIALAIPAALLVLATAAIAEPLDLDRAEQQRSDAQARQQELQAELNELLARIGELEAAQERQEVEIERLDTLVDKHRSTAEKAASQVAERYRQAYKAGTGSDPLILMVGGDDPREIGERARLLSLMASDSQREHEAAEGASRQSAALSVQLEDATAALADQTRELDEARREARDKVAEAQAQVEELDRQIAAERERRAEARRRARERAEARRQAAEERAAREEAAAAAAADETADSSSDGSSGGSSSGSSGGGGGGGGSARVSGGTACPVGTPRNYSDTYGAPRSGGRSHMGVDILAPHGTPIYAYENGTISRMDSNSLGGISLYLQGSSGNLYYYTHLSGYVSGLSTGQRVSAGQHIAFNGDTGNAAGIPHLHWEVRPGGGGNVNPYPYAYRACG